MVERRENEEVCKKINGGVEIFPASGKATLPQEFVKAEKNLEYLGFFTPSTKRTKEKIDEKVISFTTTVERKKVKVSVTILPSAKYGLPDTSDLDKYRAFQKILGNELIKNGKISNPIAFTSADLIEAMGISRGNNAGKAYSGRLHKEIEDWLMKMKVTDIQSEGAVWLARRKKRVTDTVNVFQRVVSYGDELEGGTVADCHYVWLSDWQLENINEFYLLSIDYDLHRQLRKPIAKSILPHLQIGFYASGGTYTKRYDALCQFLGIKNHRKFSYIKRQLEPSFKDLKEKRFLADWDYKENKIHQTYNVTWQAGDRFYEMQELLREREEKLFEPVTKKPKRITRPKQERTQAQQSETKAESVLETPKPQDKKEVQQPQPEIKEVPKVEKAVEEREQVEPEPDNLKPEERELFDNLVAHTVSKGVAEDLVKNFDHELIREWVEVIDFVKKADDKAAFLVSAIREGWAVSEKYLAAKKRGEQAKLFEEQDLEEQKRIEAEMEEKQREAEKLDQIYTSLSAEKQEEIEQEAKNRLPSFLRVKMKEGKDDSPMIVGTLLVKKRDVLKEWLEAGKVVEVPEES